jgi:hypothetical protein
MRRAPHRPLEGSVGGPVWPARPWVVCVRQLRSEPGAALRPTRLPWSLLSIERPPIGAREGALGSLSCTACMPSLHGGPHPPAHAGASRYPPCHPKTRHEVCSSCASIAFAALASSLPSKTRPCSASVGPVVLDSPLRVLRAGSPFVGTWNEYRPAVGRAIRLTAFLRGLPGGARQPFKPEELTCIDSNRWDCF